MERFARDELLGDLPFEFVALGAVCYGLHPLKVRQSRSIPNLQSVHRQVRTPTLLGPGGSAEGYANAIATGPFEAFPVDGHGRVGHTVERKMFSDAAASVCP